MKIIKYCLLMIFCISGIHIYSQETPLKKFENTMDDISQKAHLKWDYNPFRKNNSEKLLFGWQDPNAYITRFWIGDILSKNAMFLDPDWRLDKVLTFFSPTLATELSPIAFTLGRVKIHVGVGFLIEANLLAYNGYKLRYGAVPFYADFFNVGAYFDIIIDDSWKIRWMPIIHVCSHAGGDYLGDPLFDDTKNFADMGNENMSFALYRNWHWFTFYGGLGFRLITNYQDTYGTLFNIFLGTDMRIPIWGKINFITGFYVGASYDEIKTMSQEKRILDSYTKWYPTISIATGIEIDRITFALKYLQMRSRQVISYKQIEKRFGFETTVYF